MSHWYAIRPSDTFLIRDGRNFVTGDGSKYESTLPNPSTVGGAMGAAIGDRFGFLRGPYLAKRLPGDEWLPYFPLPMNVLSSGKERQRVSPSSAPLEGVTTSVVIGGRLTLQPDDDESWNTIKP